MSHREGKSNCYGYARVSTTEQHQDGAGLPAQITQLTSEAQRRGWELQIVTEDGGLSGGSLANRAALIELLDNLDKVGGTLMVAKLDRLTRSVADFSLILERSRKRGWQLVILDSQVDTTTAAGEMVATMLATVAQWERRIISDRTKAGMAERRRQGVRLGRPTLLPAKVLADIDRLRQTGLTLAAVANQLNAEQVPTAQGGAKWYPATVAKVLNRQVLAA